MAGFVLLLRGVNVGGHNRLPMKDLRVLLEKIGCCDVATYIQSGNAVFSYAGDASKLQHLIAARIADQFSFRPTVMLLSKAAFAKILRDSNFANDELEPKFLHVSILQQAAKKADVDKLQALAANGEAFHLTASAFYLRAPKGIGRSKLAASAERILGVPVTSRNWRSLTKIRELLEAQVL